MLAAWTLFAGCAAARDVGSVIVAENPSARSAQEKLGYSEAIIAGDTIYLSGVVAVPRAGDQGPEPAFERMFERIEATLRRAGATFDDVVEMTSYHVDMAGQIDAFVLVKHRYVKAPFPAWTAVGNAQLYRGDAVAEVRIVARKAN
ncbi:RidA family protein [Sphingopyxis sp. OAS728]|uniref:RidA family protein n=1 Tax=Sphingopyxis sp. OAS728 TaxID=2663823 RepID=UPI00178A98FB|nr:RidA family protein [Sphingopyxis sp. OAS728]